MFQHCRCALLLVLYLTSVCGCAGSKPTVSGVGTTASATRAVFEAATTAFHGALRTNDGDALFFARGGRCRDDAAGGSSHPGQGGNAGVVPGFLAQFRTSSLTLNDREVFIGEGWAVETGTYQWGLEPAARGGPIIDRGNYMQVWTSQPAGEWKFAREIWNSSVPPPGPPAK